MLACCQCKETISFADAVACRACRRLEIDAKKMLLGLPPHACPQSREDKLDALSRAVVYYGEEAFGEAPITVIVYNTHYLLRD